MKEDPLKPGGQHLRWVQGNIALIGEHATIVGNGSIYSTKKFKTVDEYVKYKLKERIKDL